MSQTRVRTGDLILDRLTDAVEAKMDEQMIPSPLERVADRDETADRVPSLLDELIHQQLTKAIARHATGRLRPAGLTAQVFAPRPAWIAVDVKPSDERAQQRREAAASMSAELLAAGAADFSRDDDGMPQLSVRNPAIPAHLVGPVVAERVNRALFATGYQR